MTKEKQIEEMAKDLGLAFQLAGTTSFCAVAEVLVNAGYRKADEVASEVCTEIGKRFESLLKMLPADGALTDAKTFIEAHWEFIEHSIVSAYDAALKKKYTESEKGDG